MINTRLNNLSARIVLGNEYGLLLGYAPNFERSFSFYTKAPVDEVLENPKKNGSEFLVFAVRDYHNFLIQKELKKKRKSSDLERICRLLGTTVEENDEDFKFKLISTGMIQLNPFELTLNLNIIDLRKPLTTQNDKSINIIRSHLYVATEVQYGIPYLTKKEREGPKLTYKL